MRTTGFLSAQCKADMRAGKGAIEKPLRLLITGLYTGKQQFGHVDGDVIQDKRKKRFRCYCVLFRLFRPEF